LWSASASTPAGASAAPRARARPCWLALTGHTACPIARPRRSPSPPPIEKTLQNRRAHNTLFIAELASHRHLLPEHLRGPTPTSAKRKPRAGDSGDEASASSGDEDASPASAGKRKAAAAGTPASAKRRLSGQFDASGGGGGKGKAPAPSPPAPRPAAKPRSDFSAFDDLGD